MATARANVSITETAHYRRLVLLLQELDACAWAREDAGLTELVLKCREDLSAFTAGAHACVVCFRPIMCDDEIKVFDPKYGHAHERCLDSDAPRFFGESAADTRRPSCAKKISADEFSGGPPAAPQGPVAEHTSAGTSEGQPVPSASSSLALWEALAFGAFKIAVRAAAAATSIWDKARPR